MSQLDPPRKTPQGEKSSENYSLDEMMNRLKSGDGSYQNEEPELVVRPDGTQMMRKRRRKRRSEQPHKTQRENKSRSLILKLAGLGGLLFCLVIGSLLLFAKYNRTSFTSDIESYLENRLKGEVNIRNLSVTPTSVRAGKVEMKWPENSFLDQGVWTRLEGDLKVTNLVVNKWEGREILAKKGVLVLKKAMSDPKVNDFSGEQSQQYAYQGYRCKDMTVIFGHHVDRAPIVMSEMEASLRDLEGRGVQLTLNEGVMKVSGFQDLGVYRGTMLFRPGMVEVTSFRFMDSSGQGKGILSGTIPLSLQDRVSLSLQLEGFLCSSLVGEQIGRLMDGRLNASPESARLIFQCGDFDSMELNIPFESPEFSMTRFQFLDIFKDLINESDYGKPVFIDKAKGEILRTKSGGVTLKNLHLERRGLLCVQGGYRILPTGELAGSLRVGLPYTRYLIAKESLMNKGEGYNLPFSALKDGYHWVDLELSGDVDNPRDNFKELLNAPKKGERGLSAPQEAFEQLIR